MKTDQNMKGISNSNTQGKKQENKEVEELGREFKKHCVIEGTTVYTVYNSI